MTKYAHPMAKPSKYYTWIYINLINHFYAMYHGAFAHTLETLYDDERGVDVDYWAIWGALSNDSFRYAYPGPLLQ